jgi:hypothetical protein
MAAVFQICTTAQGDHPISLSANLVISYNLNTVVT